MSRHDDEVSLDQMLSHAREALELADGQERDILDSNRLVTLAVERLVMIVGEAANRISANTQAKHPDVPWSQIISLRNRLTHGYDKVDLDILWTIIQDDLPPLIAHLEEILAKGE